MASGTVQLTLTVAGVSRILSLVGMSSAEFVTKDIDCGNDKQLKFLEGLICEIQTKNFLGSIDVYFGTKERLTDEPTWYGPISLADGNDPVFYSIPDFRYVRLRVVDNSVIGIWKLSAIELLGVMDGGPM